MCRKLSAIVLVVIMAVTMLPMPASAAFTSRSTDPKKDSTVYEKHYKCATSGNPYGDEKQCTWYAWGRYRELCGEKLPSWGNAGNWFDKAKSAGYPIGTTPKPGAIACWTPAARHNDWGHVAVVESVNGNQITVSQYNESFSGAFNTRQITLTKNAWPYPPSGYIYLKESTPAAPTFSFDASLTYVISPQCAPSRCLEIAGQSKENRANVQIGTKKNLTSQQFKFVSVGDGYYKIVPQNSQKSLDCASQGTTPGTNVQQYDFSNSHDSQRWWLEDAGGGYCYIVPKGNTALCLDVTGAVDKDGTNVQINTRNSSSAQKWKLIPLCNGKHTKGIFRFYEASHPHHNYWQCAACGENFTDGSTAKMASCTICNPPCASGHTWGGWTVTKAASCGVAGSRKRTCSRCGQTETETIAALSHNYQKISSTAAYDVYACANCKDGYRVDKVKWLQRPSSESGTRSVYVGNRSDTELSCRCLVARYQDGRLVSLTQEVLNIPTGTSKSISTSIPLDTGDETWKVFVLDDQSCVPLLPSLEY